MKRLSALLLLASLMSCATSPLGRKQLITVPDDTISQMGSEAFEEMKRKNPIETDSRKVRYVQCIAKSIVEQSKDKIDPESWEVVTFRHKAVNAFALPGAKIGVFTGIIPVAATQHQLAAVMGHEVAHVIARHGSERMSEALAANVGLSILSGVTRNNSSQIVSILGGVAVVGTQIVMFKFSRDHESEADIMGLYSMAQAGFDPRESVTLWKNMAKAGGPTPPEFLSTHPSNETRIQHLEAHMGEAMKLYEKARSSGIVPGCDQI